MNKTLHISEAFSFAWQELKKRFAFFTGAAAVILAINLLPTFILQKSGGLTGIIEFIFSLISLALALGLIYMAIKVVRDQEPAINDFHSGFQNFWKVLLAYILYTLALIIPAVFVLGGLFIGFLEFLSVFGGGNIPTHLLIISGILVVVGLILGLYLILRFLFFQFAIMGDKYSPIESLKRSSELTKGVKWSLLGFLIIAGVLNILGAIPFGLGLLITIPLTVLAQAYMYQQLIDQSTSQPTISSDPVNNV